MRLIALAVSLAASALSAGVAGAASLHVAPTSVNLTAPDSTSVISLRNDASEPINVQIRVFRWTSQNGVDQFEPTRDVVASPPATTLQPGSSTSIRIVRVSSAPVAGEESYRLIVDELPDPAQRRSGRVAFVMRYSIPAFFTAPDASPPEIAWSVAGGGAALVGSNYGERHVRISSLAAGERMLEPGLAGYILGHSSQHWPLSGGFSGGSIAVSAMSEAGQIDAVAAAR